MRIGVFSDTHGDVSRLPLFLEGLGKLNLAVHLGDFASDAQKIGAFFHCPTEAVRGNCDYNCKEPIEKLLTLEKKRLLLLHGHGCFGERELLYKGEEARADLVLYGHSHVPTLFADGPRLFLNPGSLSLPRYGSLPSCALVTIEKGQLNVRLLNTEKLR